MTPYRYARAPLPSCFNLTLIINPCEFGYVLSPLSLEYPPCSKAPSSPNSALPLLQFSEHNPEEVPCMVCPLKRSKLHFALADAPIPTVLPTLHGVASALIPHRSHSPLRQSRPLRSR